MLGESLRACRIAQGRTLRDVSHAARLSLGYLSEIERGQKEASSELLAGIATALDVPLSRIAGDVADRFARREAVVADLQDAHVVPLRPWTSLSRAA
jgi:transcriptional regulator with XRE-family HTH domain